MNRDFPQGSEPGAMSYSTGRAVLVVGDGPAAQSRATAAVLSAGLRTLAVVEPADALVQLGRLPAGASVVVEIEAALSEAAARNFEMLLVGLNREAARGRHASVVATPTELIDIVAALAPDPRIHQLADADDADRLAALILASSPQRAGVRDSGGDAAGRAELHRVAGDGRNIADALARIASSPRFVAPPPDAPDAAPGQAITAQGVRGLIRARRIRAHHFPDELFADPAWDMLLDLFAARLAGEPVAVSSLCIAAAVPATTALRWIRTLTDAGLFVRRADPADGRRVFIEMSEPACERMHGYFAALARLAHASGATVV